MLAHMDPQEELALRNQELVALTAIGDATSQFLDLDTILRTALEKVVALLNLEVGELVLVDGKRKGVWAYGR